MEQLNNISMNDFVLVPEDKEFKFKRLCPYCNGDLTYKCTGWEQDDDGKWMADHLESECSNEPQKIGSKKWEEWMEQHSDLPYVNQLPVDQKVKAQINSIYRFNID